MIENRLGNYGLFFEANKTGTEAGTGSDEEKKNSDAPAKFGDAIRESARIDPLGLLNDALTSYSPLVAAIVLREIDEVQKEQKPIDPPSETPGKPVSKT